MVDAGEKTPSNVGTGGVGVFKDVLNDLFRFKKINAGSSNITITDDTGNNEVDVDVGTNIPKKDAANTFTAQNTLQYDSGDDTAIIYKASNSANSANGFLFQQKDSGNAVQTYGAIYNKILTNTAGVEDGYMQFAIEVTGTLTPTLQMNPTGMLYIGLNRRLGFSDVGLTGIREFSLPDVSDEIVSKTATQTLTNKTLTTPTLTTPVINGVTFGDVGITNSDSPYTVLSTKTIIRADASSGAITINLPTAASIAGRTYKIYRTDVAASTNLITIDGNSTETIDSNLTYKLFAGEWVHIESDGTNWVVIARPSPFHQGYVFLADTTNNRRYVAGLGPDNLAGLITSTTTPGQNLLWAMPLYVGKTTKFDTISFAVTTVVASQNARCGIYRDNGKCYPGALIFDTGSISVASGTIKDTTITSSLQVFQPGLYWLAWETSASATLQIRALPGAGSCINFAGCDSVLATTAPGFAWRVAHTFGALPDPYTSSATLITTPSAIGTPIPAVGLRAV